MSDRILTDIDRLNFLEETARLSRTGISFDWHNNGSENGYRFIHRHYTGTVHNSIRKAIDTTINEKGWKAK